MLSCICHSHSMNHMFFIEDEILYSSHKLPEKMISAWKREMQKKPNSEWRQREGQSKCWGRSLFSLGYQPKVKADGAPVYKSFHQKSCFLDFLLLSQLHLYWTCSSDTSERESWVIGPNTHKPSSIAYQSARFVTLDVQATLLLR